GDDDNGYVLLLAGEEIHDQARVPQCNHLLVYGAEMELAQCADNPQALIDAVKSANGLSFIAHPNDHSLDLVGEAAIPWEDWQVQRFTGLEVWNYMSTFKTVITRRRDVPRAAFRPEELITGPEPATLALWDRLLSEGKHIVGVGNADAHGTTVHLGPFTHTI